ncbi:LUD domain-containing protein [Polaribacter cellanae]|uniref:LUD domain-containing protein n=1 Tax=Polaribacter cellanae TaxID=2818493 RepID=A0A975CR44_9FLAO|nr:LUD domain-containing protein [Polaribacter cellanae]QTE23815.1 LUD domain-containing protein [Polaribacter cellanae]
MNFLKKLLNIPVKEDKEIQKQEVDLSLDDLFVHNFIEKGGKFLYCLKKEEISESLEKVLLENNWNELLLLDNTASSLIKNKTVNTISKFNNTTPVFTTCEHLIADNGDILFSSNQLKSTKLSELSKNFIVYATTSQLVKDTGQGLTGIKTNSKDSLPTNISSIKNYNINNNDDNFLNYGNSNSKNLYLLLLEDL